jgi:hypothetical protein
MTYEEFIAEQERLCGASVTLGSIDPYGAECALDRGHRGPHVSPNPFGGDGVYEWTGGGSCAGDPLPVRNSRFLERPCDLEFGPHEHDEAECQRILDTMNGIGVDDGSWEREMYNREAEAMDLGRPLFPNEY